MIHADEQTVCELVSKVCDAIDGGAESVREACRIVDVPQPSVLRWIDNPEKYGLSADLLGRYARARDGIVASLCDQLGNVAAGKHRPEGTDDATSVARDRLHVDALKWKLSKLMPRTMGDKVTHSGDEDAPITTQTITDRDRAKAMAALVMKAKTQDD